MKDRLIQLNAASLENARLNLDLVRTLEKSNTELVHAYDATIEALSYALDLKDSETKWHSKRVADLTILVAKAMGMGEESLVHMAQGRPPSRYRQNGDSRRHIAEARPPSTPRKWK